MRAHGTADEVDFRSACGHVLAESRHADLSSPLCVAAEDQKEEYGEKGIVVSACFVVSSSEAACTLRGGMLYVVLCCPSDSTDHC